MAKLWSVPARTRSPSLNSPLTSEETSELINLSSPASAWKWARGFGISSAPSN